MHRLKIGGGSSLAAALGGAAPNCLAQLCTSQHIIVQLWLSTKSRQTLVSSILRCAYRRFSRAVCWVGGIVLLSAFLPLSILCGIRNVFCGLDHRVNQMRWKQTVVLDAAILFKRCRRIRL